MENDVVSYYGKVLELVRKMKEAKKYSDDTINQFVMKLQGEISMSQPDFDSAVARIEDYISMYTPRTR